MELQVISKASDQQQERQQEKKLNSKIDAFVSKDGYICLYFNGDVYAQLSPLVAKRLSKRLDEASNKALQEVFFKYESSRPAN